MTETQKAIDVAQVYNKEHEMTKLAWSEQNHRWELFHNGNLTKQSYSDKELIEVGTRLKWGDDNA